MHLQLKLSRDRPRPLTSCALPRKRCQVSDCCQPLSNTMGEELQSRILIICLKSYQEKIMLLCLTIANKAEVLTSGPHSPFVYSSRICIIIALLKHKTMGHPNIGNRINNNNKIWAKRFLQEIEMYPRSLLLGVWCFLWRKSVSVDRRCCDAFQLRSWGSLIIKHVLIVLKVAKGWELFSESLFL